LTVAVPEAVESRKLAGVEQVAVPAVVPATRVQGEPVMLTATPVSVNATVPTGVVGLLEVSVTVALQVKAWFTTTALALQVTAVVVG
jgi:hypothetical protein